MPRHARRARRRSAPTRRLRGARRVTFGDRVTAALLEPAFWAGDLMAFAAIVYDGAGVQDAEACATSRVGG